MSDMALRRTAVTGGRKPSSRTPHSRPSKVAYMLVWPSGRGDEIGTVRGDADTLWSIIQSAGSAHDLVMHDVDDDGARSLILIGLASSPVCLTAEPELPSGWLSVIADATADVAPIRAALIDLFGDRVEMAG